MSSNQLPRMPEIPCERCPHASEITRIIEAVTNTYHAVQRLNEAINGPEGNPEAGLSHKVREMDKALRGNGVPGLNEQVRILTSRVSTLEHAHASDSQETHAAATWWSRFWADKGAILAATVLATTISTCASPTITRLAGGPSIHPHVEISPYERPATEHYPPSRAVRPHPR